jgi:hypothetical protein
VAAASSFAMETISVSTVAYPRRRSWAERIRRSLEGCRFGKPSIGLCLFEEGFCLDFFGLLLSLPFLDRWRHEPREMMEKWGVYLDCCGSKTWFSFDSIVLCWGDYTKFLHMPWEWRHHSTTVRRPDGSFVKSVASYEEGPNNPPDGREYLSAPYHYMLDNGEVQHVTATINVERMEWRRKFTRWLPAFMGPLFAKSRVCIDVRFDDEVGERRGSWKGGTIGCGYEMKPGEEPLETLRRMQRERRFN